MSTDNTKIDLKELIDGIFVNTFLLAVTNKLDLAKVSAFVDNRLGEESSNGEFDEKYTGLAFIELLSEEMHVPVGDILNRSPEYRKTLIATIVSELSMEGVVLDIDNSDIDDAYITYSLSGLKPFEKNAEFVEKNENDSEAYFEQKNEYLIEIEKQNSEYSMSILTNNLDDSRFLSGQIEVWKEESGILADFADEALEENQIYAFKDGVSEDELVACVFEDTRTIRLLDKFEGFESKSERTYHHLVIKNGMRYCSYGDPYIHLVIERRTTNNVVGDITFTNFKLGEISGLRQHIIEELDQSILANYFDKNQFYRFNTGYLLRAQNSKNRDGYGWKWNWKNGVGTYVKGTEYGETTDYVFVGAYISSSYIYDPQTRLPMLELYEAPIDLIEKTSEEDTSVEVSIEESANDDIAHKESSNEIPTKSNGSSKTVEVPIFDVEKLREQNDGKSIKIGSTVKYKKLHTGEIVEMEIDPEKIVHRKLLGKKVGDIVVDGKKRYLVITITDRMGE